MAGFILLLVSVIWLGCSDEAAPGGSGDVAQLLPPGDVIQVRDGEYSPGAPPTSGGPDAGAANAAAASAAAADAGAAAAGPTSGAAPQIVRVTGPASVTNGGTALLHVEVSPPLTAPRFAVWHEGDDGYHSVAGVDPEADGVYDISVTVAAAANQSSLLLNVALLDAAGNAGPVQQLEIALIQSGNGDVKITLSFDRLHDLDLHVIEPNGDEIYYQQPLSESGGRLDLDSGVHCQSSAANGENIFWPSGGAPVGEYRVSVQNYEQCTPGEIAFTVTVQHGMSVETFDGSFPDGSAGEAPSAANLIQLTTFRHER